MTGYESKSAAAAVKLFEDHIVHGTSWSKNGERIDPASVYLEQTAQEPICDMGAMCLGCEPRNPDGSCPDAPPAQEPIAYVTGTYNGRFVVAPLNPAMVLSVGMAFYTTPPKRPWVGLTEEDFVLINQLCINPIQSAEFAERLLKEKNNG